MRTPIILILFFALSAGFNCRQSEPIIKNLPDSQADRAPVTHLTNSQQMIQERISNSRENAITMAVNNVSPAIVGINVVQIRRYRQHPFEDDPFWGYFFRPREYEQKVKGLGSGFLISPDGYILTNEHVVHEASEIIVTTTDGEQYEAESIGEDMNYDVALLKIKGNDFPYISLGNSDDIITGEWAIALGNPFGLFDVNTKPTVTVGVISALGMDFQGELKIEGRTYENMIQTDASINSGNSGGPLVNSLGECIGINTFILSGGNYSQGSIGIGFAIPINRVKQILPDLKTIGRVDRSFQTGLIVENLNVLTARMLGINPRDGVIVSRITEGTPADEAGLEISDVIVAIDNIRVRSTSDVQRIIDALDVTQIEHIDLQVYRKGNLINRKLRLEK